MSTTYLNLGSNQGDRKAHIEQAVALIIEAYPEAVVRRSQYIETEAWGYQSEARFLNLGIALDMAEQPDAYAMLDILQRIEREISTMTHRNADGTYRDREIDIDIIEIDDLQIKSRRLTLPHPRAYQRDFVTIPLQQLKC